MASAPADLENVARIRAKYAEEARKRLRPDGTAQFVSLKRAEDEHLRSLVNDPWVDHEALNARPPCINDGDHIRVFTLGAGFGGLLFAVHLIKTGVFTADDIRLVDAAGGFGGTWYWNRYPGLHCDVESYTYLPLLEETGYVPSHKYAPGLEVREHAERIASLWKLEDKAMFRSDVHSVEWNDASRLWKIHFTERRGPGVEPVERRISAQYVYLAAGVLTSPQVPKIPGLSTFKGSMFHTARWDYTVSGGSQENQTLSALQEKRVAVVGTAATGIGVIPAVAQYAKELFVVQRTPAYVKPRGQHRTDPDEFKAKVATKSGWQLERQLNANRFLTNANEPGEPNLINDAWTDMPAYSALVGSPSHGIVDDSPESLERLITSFHVLDLPHMEAVRARVDSIVKDPETASNLKPWYPSWCKRPTFSDMYLQTFNEPHVHLVDTNGKGPEGATERGLVVAGKEYPVDVIVFGTGYEVPQSGSPASRINVRVTGRGGRSLDEKWRTTGAATLHGWSTNSCPNLFFSGTSQATITGNNTWMLDFTARHVSYCIATAERRAPPGKRAVVEVTKEAEEAHTAEVVKRAPYFSTTKGCTPSYFNAQGATIADPEGKKRAARGSIWSEGTASFLDRISKWRDEGSMEGMDVAFVSRDTAVRSSL